MQLNATCPVSKSTPTLHRSTFTMCELTACCRVLATKNKNVIQTMDQTNFQNNSLIFQNNYNKFSFNTIFQT